MLRRIIVAIFALGIILIVGFSAGYLAFLPTTTTTTNNLVRIEITGVVLKVELATTPAQQTQGLSGRDSLAPDHGMLFVFNTEDYWAFWMNGMKFPLDIVWFDSNRQAVFFKQDLQPCGQQGCPTFSPTSKATYVLEVNAGFVLANHVSLGDMFTYVTT